MPGYLTLVTEDLPSEIASEIILAHVYPEGVVANRIGRKGNGYIQSKLKGFNEAAAPGLKIFVLTDRDKPANCPIELRQLWLRGPQSEYLVVRFAEMEVEAWILADPQGIAAYLDVPAARVPGDVDQLADPKQSLVNLARSSRSRRVREDMCPTQGAKNLVGPAYNPRLEEFLRLHWRVDIAIANSPSLNKAAIRMRELMERP